MSDIRRVVVGVGLSSQADAAEVRQLVETALSHHEVTLADVAVIATRERFVDDDRLRLGPPIVGYPDGLLEEMSAPCERTVGIRARVAETAARLASRTESDPVVERSAHTTVAVVVARPRPG